MPDTEFFEGPPLYHFFHAAMIHGAGQVDLGPLTVQYKPNHVNGSMLDIVRPRPTVTEMGQIEAGEYANCNDVSFKRLPGGLLIDVRAGRVGHNRFSGAGQHVLWFIPPADIHSIGKTVKKKLMGGQKTANVVARVHSFRRPDVTLDVKFKFINGSLTGPFGDYLLAAAAAAHDQPVPAWTTTENGQIAQFQS